MLVSFIVTTAVGTILGLRFKVFVLVPAILFVGIGTSTAGMLARYDARFIWLSVAAHVVLLQIGYLAGCFLSTQRIFRSSTWALTPGYLPGCWIGEDLTLIGNVDSSLVGFRGL